MQRDGDIPFPEPPPCPLTANDYAHTYSGACASCRPAATAGPAFDAAIMPWRLASSFANQCASNRARKHATSASLRRNAATRSARLRSHTASSAARSLTSAALDQFTFSRGGAERPARRTIPANIPLMLIPPAIP